MEMTKKDLWKLRKRICLNSLYVSDYENNMGFTASSVCDFFDGFISFIGEMIEEKYGTDADFWAHIDEFDNADELEAWYYCFEDFPFEIEEEEGEEEE